MAPEDAARAALAAYLRAARFCLHGGSPAVGELAYGREVGFTEVLEGFPEPSRALTFPSASIAMPTAPALVQGFGPRALEHTYDPASGTVLWYLGRAEGTLQLDLWAGSVAERSALSANLAALMNPGEIAGVHLPLPAEYAPGTARFTLLSWQPLDPPDAVWAGERRLQATLGFEVPVLALRPAVLLSPRAPLEVDPEGP